MHWITPSPTQTSLGRSGCKYMVHSAKLGFISKHNGLNGAVRSLIKTHRANPATDAVLWLRTPNGYAPHPDNATVTWVNTPQGLQPHPSFSSGVSMESGRA